APSAKALEPIAVEPVKAVPPPVAVEPTPSARSKGLVAAPLKPMVVKSTSCADAPLGKRAIAPAAAATRKNFRKEELRMFIVIVLRTKVKVVREVIGGGGYENSLGAVKHSF